LSWPSQLLHLIQRFMVVMTASKFWRGSFRRLSFRSTWLRCWNTNN
jgi:hypothetical protein